MRIDASKAQLREIEVDKIDQNPENPRLFFRQGELDTLQDSIRQHGIQVPVSVFKKNGRYVLIDGERRWRCSVKLNLRRIPALVQEEPDELTNMLLMFNIHALREQWDLLTIAVKLPSVIELLTSELKKEPTEAEIAAKTGLNRSIIRRCKLLMELPDRYQELLLEELGKPKTQQRLTEDFFIEMERALKTVERSMPGVVRDKNKVRDVLIKKYESETIKDLTDLRYLPRIAKAEAVQFDRHRAQRALLKVFDKNEYSIEMAYESTVADAYSGRDLVTKITGLSERLGDMIGQPLEEEMMRALHSLRSLITKVLRSHE